MNKYIKNSMHCCDIQNNYQKVEMKNVFAFEKMNSLLPKEIIEVKWPRR